MKKATIYPKHDFLLDRDLTAAERLEGQQREIEFMKRYLEQLSNTLRNASNLLTEDELMTIAEAVHNAHNAVSNATFLGQSGYHALPVDVVCWNRDELVIRKYAASYDFNIVGNLTRSREWERNGDRLYKDEGGNKYLVSNGECICICEKDGYVW